MAGTAHLEVLVKMLAGIANTLDPVIHLQFDECSHGLELDSLYESIVVNS
jgi:hypothetical protein